MRQLPRSQIILASTISWVVSSTIYPLPVWAQTSGATGNENPSSNADQRSPDFSSEGRPGRRTGGGSRSPCPPTDPPLTALIPASNFGKTVAERPTFWFYVPYSSQQVSVGEFVLQSEQGEDIYRTPFALPKTPGFVSFSIPQSVAPLEVNQTYRWYFKLYCEPQKASAPVFVEGWVQRVELTPTLESQLRSDTAQEYIVYAANGIWYDALAHLAQLRLNHSTNAWRDREWTSLLGAKGVGLEQLSEVPMVGSVLIDQRLGAKAATGS